MTIFKTKNGVFTTNGALENSGIAVAFNIENLLLKVNKFNSDSWKAETATLIGKKIHTVLAQYDQNGRYPGRMLNAGGLLTFVTNEAEGSRPLGMMMVLEKNGLQLGFGKVELRDLDQGLSNLQTQLDEKLKSILLKLLSEAKDKEDFVAKIKNVEITAQFAELERIIVEDDKTTAEILSPIAARQDLPEQKSSFERPPLNKFTVKAIKAAAVREIAEELEFQMNAQTLDPARFIVGEDLNREVATDYVRSVLAISDKSKFSAKEFNDDFESTTFVVTCVVEPAEFKSLTHKQDCKLIEPNDVQIKIVNPEKGILQTLIAGCPPILGGGNQFTVALFCKNVLGKQATFIPLEVSAASSPDTFFASDKTPAAGGRPAVSEDKTQEGPPL